MRVRFDQIFRTLPQNLLMYIYTNKIYGACLHFILTLRLNQVFCVMSIIINIKWLKTNIILYLLISLITYLSVYFF